MAKCDRCGEEVPISNDAVIASAVYGCLLRNEGLEDMLAAVKESILACGSRHLRPVGECPGSSLKEGIEEDLLWQSALQVISDYQFISRLCGEEAA